MLFQPVYSWHAAPSSSPQDPLYLELIYLAYVICISFDSPAKQE